MTQYKYDLKIADDVDVDVDEIVEQKKEYGTYQSNIDKFLEEIYLAYKTLRTSPKIGVFKIDVFFYRKF